MTEPEKVPLPEAWLVLVWPLGRPYRLVVSHDGRLVEFALRENAGHVLDRIREDGLRAEVVAVDADQVKDHRELVPAGEGMTLEVETGWQEDRAHCRFVAKSSSAA